MIKKENPFLAIVFCRTKRRAKTLTNDKDKKAGKTGYGKDRNEGNKSYGKDRKNSTYGTSTNKSNSRRGNK